MKGKKKMLKQSTFEIWKSYDSCDCRNEKKNYLHISRQCRISTNALARRHDICTKQPDYRQSFNQTNMDIRNSILGL